MKHPSHATVVAYLALIVAMTGTAEAATGGGFLLGRSNTESTVSVLKNVTPGKSALNLYTAKNNVAPFRVGTNQTKVPNLNADLVDGLHSSAFLRTGSTAANASALGGTPAAGYQLRITGQCPGNDGTDVQGINSDGTVVCHNALAGTGAIVLSAFLCPPGSMPDGTAEVGNGAGGTDAYQLCRY